MKSGTGKNTSAALLAIPLAATMLLAGCGGDTKPSASASSKTSSSPTTTAAPTASTSPTAVVIGTTDPDVPAAARAHTIAGAEAFVRYFIQRQNVAYSAPQPGILFPLCQSPFHACSVFEKKATRLAKQGHRYDGDPLAIDYVGVLDATNPNKFGVLANLVQVRRSEVERTGKVVSTDPRKKFRAYFEVSKTARGWLVSSISLMK